MRDRRRADVHLPHHRHPDEFETDRPPLPRARAGGRLAVRRRLRERDEAHRRRLLRLLPRPGLARQLLPRSRPTHDGPHLAGPARPRQRRARRAAPVRRPADRRRACCSATCTPTTASTCAATTCCASTTPPAPQPRIPVWGPERHRRPDGAGLRPAARPGHAPRSSTSAPTTATGRARAVRGRRRSPVEHPVPAFGLRVSADGAHPRPTPATPAPAPGLDDVAADADLLLAEASFRAGDDNPPTCTSPAPTAATSPTGGGASGWCSPTSRRGTTRGRAAPRRPEAYDGPLELAPRARSTTSDAVSTASDQPGVVDADRDLHPVGDLELVEEPGHVRLHGRHRQVSSPAISALLRPRPTARATSRSRSVRLAEPAPRAAARCGRPAGRSRIRLDQGAGDRRATASGRRRRPAGSPRGSAAAGCP